jgi:hypothetical protein
MTHRYIAYYGADRLEARLLSWKCHHVPFASMMLGGLLTACVLSAFLSLLSVGPWNIMP